MFGNSSLAQHYTSCSLFNHEVHHKITDRPQMCGFFNELIEMTYTKVLLIFTNIRLSDQKPSICYEIKLIKITSLVNQLEVILEAVIIKVIIYIYTYFTFGSCLAYLAYQKWLENSTIYTQSM